MFTPALQIGLMVAHWPLGQLKHLTSTTNSRLVLTDPHTGYGLFGAGLWWSCPIFDVFPKEMWCVWQNIIDRVCFIYFYFFYINYMFSFSSTLFWWAPRCQFKSFIWRIFTIKTSFILEIFQSKRQFDLIFKRSSLHQKSTALQWHSHQRMSRGKVFYFFSGYFNEDQ